MTDEEILNGNELIAKFMGYQILNKKYETQYMCSSNESAWTVTEGEIVCDSQGREVDDESQEPYLYLEHLPFNSSWDWLIPVVEKIISTIGLKTTDECTTDELKLYTTISQMRIGTPKDIVFYNVVKYIELYNKNV